MGAAGTIEEFKVGVDGFAGTRETDRKLVLHRVEVEGALQGLTAQHLGAITGMRRKVQLRIDARDLDVRRVRNVDRQSTLRRAEGIAIEDAALVALADDVDDSEEAHGRA